VPILIPHLGLAIYTSPKVLSTSLKYFAFELENGRPFEELRKAGHPIWVHRHYPARPFEPVDRREFPHVVAFVRDPVKRFVSMFRNRVIKHHEQTAGKWSEAATKGLERTPSFSDFIAKFDHYDALIPDVRHHAAPQVEYVGADSGFYDEVFTAESVSEFESFVHDLSGIELHLPWVQRSGLEASVTLDNVNLTWISERYSEDYQVFGRWFPPASEWEQKSKEWRKQESPSI